MSIYKIILILAILSLLAVSFIPQRVIAEPVEIVKLPNIKVYAFEKVLDKWGDKQWSYFDDLIQRESQWVSTAHNPKSTAYGLGQFLDSTWKIVGCKKTEDKYKQIDCMINYISLRYTNPQKAIKFWDKNHYY